MLSEHDMNNLRIIHSLECVIQQRPMYYYNDGILKWGEDISPENMEKLKGGEIFILQDEHGKDYCTIIQDVYGNLKQKKLENVKDYYYELIKIKHLINLEESKFRLQTKEHEDTIWDLNIQKHKLIEQCDHKFSDGTDAIEGGFLMSMCKICGANDYGDVL